MQTLILLWVTYRTDWNKEVITINLNSANQLYIYIYILYCWCLLQVAEANKRLNKWGDKQEAGAPSILARD